MLLIVLTPELNADNEISIVNAMLRAGLQKLHIRKPSFSLSDYERYILAVDRQYHSRLVIHDFFELYAKFSLGGIHLNSTGRGDKKVWASITDVPDVSISTSFHSWQEIEQSQFNYGYVFISPVFNSISKVGYHACIDLTQVKNVREKVKSMRDYCPKIIGLGGVGESQIQVLNTHGFDGAAVLGAIWKSSDPLLSFERIMSASKFPAAL